MNHEFLFYSGLPRSGGTMLASVLNQHPDLYVSSLSPTIELLYHCEEYFKTSDPFIADPNHIGKNAILRSMPQQYYAHIEKKYIVDNSRGWPNNIQRIKDHITPDPKIVCIVRDIPSILASFITLAENEQNKRKNFIDLWLLENNLDLTTENRCMYLMQPIGIVNQSLWSMYQGYSSPDSHRLHIVEYDDLVSSPDEVLYNITKFWGVSNHKFDFNNIKNVTPVDDMSYGFDGMHDVRPVLKNRNLDPEKILGKKLVEQYSGLEYWRKSKKMNKYKVFGI
jgi:hypothetical protein